MALAFVKNDAESVPVQISRHLRRQIGTGVLKPGQRIPSNGELASLWKVSNKSIQQGVAPLVAEGLIERRRKHGTFVGRSTALATVGVLFGPSLTAESAYFIRAMARAFKEELGARDYACRFYDGLSGNNRIPVPADAEVRRHFKTDLLNNRFIGLIEFATGHMALSEWLPGIDLPTLVWEPNRGELPVSFDLERFAFDGVAYLARMGRRRIACFGMNLDAPSCQVDTELAAGILRAVGEFNLPHPQSVPGSDLPIAHTAESERGFFACAQAAIAAWMRQPEPARPDALLIKDDILTRAVSLALVHAGVRVPGDVLVLTQASEGIDLHYGIPVVRYVFSPAAAARTLVDLLWRKLRGEPLPPLPISLPGHIVPMDSDKEGDTR